MSKINSTPEGYSAKIDPTENLQKIIDDLSERVSVLERTMVNILYNAQESAVNDVATAQEPVLTPPPAWSEPTPVYAEHGVTPAPDAAVDESEEN